VENLVELMKLNKELLVITLEFLMKIKTNLLDIIFSSEEGSNLAFKNLIVESINLYIKTNAEELSKEIRAENIPENSSKSPVIDLLDYFLSLLSNNEAAKNWTKIAAYLEVT
jgi:hypothetical protein